MFDAHTAAHKAKSNIPHLFLHQQCERKRADGRFKVELLEHKLALRGCYLPPHSHPDSHQVILLKEGGGTFTADGRQHAITAPSIIILPAYCVHAFDYFTDTVGWVISISRSYLQGLISRAGEFASLSQRIGVIPCNGSADTVDDLFSAAARLHVAMDSSALGAMVEREALLLVLLIGVLRGSAGCGADSTEPVFTPGGIIGTFLGQLEQHYCDNWTIEDYCRAQNVTRKNLRAACLTAANQSPLALVHSRIMVEAKRYLHYTTLPISEVAFRIGFDDQSYFTRFFRRHQGTTPAAFRRHSSDLPALPSTDSKGDAVTFSERRSAGIRDC